MSSQGTPGRKGGGNRGLGVESLSQHWAVCRTECQFFLLFFVLIERKVKQFAHNKLLPGYFLKIRPNSTYEFWKRLLESCNSRNSSVLARLLDCWMQTPQKDLVLFTESQTSDFHRGDLFAAGRSKHQTRSVGVDWGQLKVKAQVVSNEHVLPQEPQAPFSV